jgi:hypothetical protein
VGQTCGLRNRQDFCRRSQAKAGRVEETPTVRKSDLVTGFCSRGPVGRAGTGLAAQRNQKLRIAKRLQKNHHAEVVTKFFQAIERGIYGTGFERDRSDDVMR